MHDHDSSPIHAFLLLCAAAYVEHLGPQGRELCLCDSLSLEVLLQVWRVVWSVRCLEAGCGCSLTRHTCSQRILGLNQDHCLLLNVEGMLRSVGRLHDGNSERTWGTRERRTAAKACSTMQHAECILTTGNSSSYAYIGAHAEHMSVCASVATTRSDSLVCGCT